MPSFTIPSSAGRQWATATIEQINGQPGLGFFQLTLQLTLHVDAADDQSTEQLADLCADVRIGPRMLGRLTTPPQALPIRATTWGQESSVGLSIDLDLVRLEALEAARQGSDLQLSLMVYTRLISSSGDSRWSTSTAGYLVNQGMWVQVLNSSVIARHFCSRFLWSARTYHPTSLLLPQTFNTRSGPWNVATTEMP